MPKIRPPDDSRLVVPARVTVINFAIGCCAFAMAVVMAVAIAAAM